MRMYSVAILFFALLVYGGSVNGAPGPADKLQHYIDAYNQADGSNISAAQLISYINKLDEKRNSIKDEKGFINYLFDKTHRRFLRSYAQYATFSQTLETGTYNCLTGTALYALLLDHFQIDYKIIETNYHIFLLAHTSNGDVLLEATDPENGFVSESSSIENRIKQYRLNEIERARNTKHYFEYTAELYKEVNLDEMTGLLYYNLSIVSYNTKELVKSVEQLQQAARYYQSARIEEFSRLLLLTVVDSELEQHQKERCIKNLESIRKTSVNFTARVGQ